MSDLLEKTLKKLKISELKGLIKNRKYKIKLTQKKQDLINDICTHVTSPKPKQKTKVKGGMLGIKSVKDEAERLDLISPGPIEQKLIRLYGPYMGFMIKIDNCKIIFLGERHDEGNPKKEEIPNISSATSMDNIKKIFISLKYFFELIIKEYKSCYLAGELNNFPVIKGIINLKTHDIEQRNDFATGYSIATPNKQPFLNKFTTDNTYRPNIKDIADINERVKIFYTNIIFPLANKKIHKKPDAAYIKNEVSKYDNAAFDLEHVLISQIKKLQSKYSKNHEYMNIINNFEKKINENITELKSITIDEYISKYVSLYLHMYSYLNDLKTLDLIFDKVKTEKVIIIYGGSAHIRTLYEIIMPVKKLDWVNIKPLLKKSQSEKIKEDAEETEKNPSNFILLNNDFFKQIEIFKFIKEDLVKFNKDDLY